MKAPDARTFALACHANHRYGEIPYSVHLESVVGLVAEHGGDDEALAAAWLHDVVEDATVLPSEIADRFGDVVAAAVVFCTDPEVSGGREARKRALYDFWRRGGHDWRGPLVKLCDRLSNVQASANVPHKLEKYAGEQAAFAAAIRASCDSPIVERLLGAIDAELMSPRRT